MIVKYFKGLEYRPSKFGNELYMLTHIHHDWYCCAYKNSSINKAAILKESQGFAEKDLTWVQKAGFKPGQPLVPWDSKSRHWQFHHVIERHNLSDLPLEAMGLKSLRIYHSDIVPTVMIYNVQHQQSFTNAFGISELRELYLHANASKAEKWEIREKENNALYLKGKYTLDNAIDTAMKMAHFYEAAYTFHRHYVLSTISKNFFDELLDQMHQLKKN